MIGRPTARVTDPFIDGYVPGDVLQGLEDRVVPPEQSRIMAEALRARGCRSRVCLSLANSTGSASARPLSGAWKLSCLSTGRSSGSCPRIG